MTNDTSESLQSFGEPVTVELSNSPDQYLSEAEATEALAKQLAGKKVAAVFYPDGGAKAFSTVGIHAYFAVPGESNADSPTRCYVANTGYTFNEPKVSYNIVATLDVHGALKGTNNVGELTALMMSIRTVNNLLEKGVDFESINVAQDSTYAINCYKDWMENWARNGWRRRTGEPVQNLDILKPMLEEKKRLRFLSKRADLRWVKGHSYDVGNNKADALTNEGYKLPLGQPHQPSEIMKYAVNGSSVLEKIASEKAVEMLEEIAQEAWKEATKETKPAKPVKQVVNPLMRQTAFYFITGHVKPDTEEQKYMFANLFKDSVFGERHPQNGYSLIVTKQPTQVIDRIVERMSSINAGGQICEVALKEVFSSKTYKMLMEEGEGDLYKQKLSSNVLSKNLSFNEKPLATIMNPPLRAMLSISHYNVLDNILTQFRNGNYEQSEDVSITDVTDQFFVEEVKGKKTVTKVVKHFTTAEKVFKVSIDPIKGEKRKIVLPFYVGSDIPIRNIIGALSDLSPKVNVIAIREGLDAIRYYTVFESECGIGIFSSLHSNFVKVLF